MRLRAPVLAVLLGGAACWLMVRAQQPAAQTSSPVAAIPADQRTIEMFQRIAQYPGRLAPYLEQVHTSEWVAKGAPATYNAQLASARQQIDAIRNEMSSLAEQPENMQDSIRALFRVQTFHRLIDSLMGGLRKYQNPALADLIQSVAVEDQEDLSRLQEYILELANAREQEFRVVDHEAQRCRATLSKEPAKRK
jgi:hypothetical protein